MWGLAVPGTLSLEERTVRSARGGAVGPHQALVTCTTWDLEPDMDSRSTPSAVLRDRGRLSAGSWASQQGLRVAACPAAPVLRPLIPRAFCGQVCSRGSAAALLRSEVSSCRLSWLGAELGVPSILSSLRLLGAGDAWDSRGTTLLQPGRFRVARSSESKSFELSPSELMFK